MIVAFVELRKGNCRSECNRRNIVTVLRTAVKSHKGLKGTKIFACGSFGRNLKNFSKFAGKSPW